MFGIVFGRAKMFPGNKTFMATFGNKSLKCAFGQVLFQEHLDFYKNFDIFLTIEIQVDAEV